MSKIASDPDLPFASALEQARLVREREVSPVELADMYLERIERLNDRLGTYLTVSADYARRAARAAEATAGQPGNPPFHGVPISIKDLNATAGIRTTWGTRAWADKVPDYDDEVVARVKADGFVILGKTVTPEFGPLNVSEPPGFPPGRNPWNPDFACGGSSGGAASGVAAGLCPVSQGSDGGGSIRNPSSWCGVFGIKPSRGRISDKPKAQQFFSVQGPITRYVADGAALLDAMSGPAPGDAFWAPPPARPFLDEAGADPGKRRIAFTTVSMNAEVPVAAANAAATEEAARVLEGLGHYVERVEHPLTGTNLLGPSAIMFAASYAGMAPEMPPLDRLSPWMANMVQMGKGIPAADYVVAQNTVIDVSRRFVEWFQDWDVLVTPTVAAPPPPVGKYAEPTMAQLAELWGLTPFTAMFNTTGQPAVNIPWCLDPGGLPVGVQIAGRPADEALLIRLSAQLEAAHPWAHWRPPVS
jgi:amidase